MKIKIKKYRNEGTLEIPKYQTEGSAGFDIVANDTSLPRVLYPGERITIGTNMCVEIPEGYELQIRSRSGLAYNKGVVVLNSPGTIDSDYRGEVKVILMNHTRDMEIEINNGDRIAQGVLNKYDRVDFEITEEDLSSTERGDGGLGSTGV